MSGKGADATPESVAPWAGVAWNTFSDASQAILNDWTIVKLAVDQEWGGPDSRDSFDLMVDTLLEDLVGRWDRKKEAQQEVIADYLDEAIYEYFNVQAEDGSVDQISRRMTDLYQLCSMGNLTKALGVLRESEERWAKRGGGTNTAAAKSKAAAADVPVGATPASADESKSAPVAGGRTMAAAAAAAAAAAPAPAPASAATAGAADAATDGVAAMSLAEAPAAAPAAAADDDGWTVVTGRRRGRKGKKGRR